MAQGLAYVLRLIATELHKGHFSTTQHFLSQPHPKAGGKIFLKCLFIRAENLSHMLPSSHTHVQHRPSCKRGWKKSSASLVGLGTASREEVGGRGTRGWHGRDSCRIGKRVRVQRRKLILAKRSRRNLSQGINWPTKSG